MNSTDELDDPAVAAALAEVLTAEPVESADAVTPQQTEMPFALVYGKAVTELPQDFYIPPDALEVFLEAFEGPLDLLLYLIRRQNMDILDIQVAHITRQYMEYIEVMKHLNFDLVAEYLVMAAILGEIKSRMLLPRPKNEEGVEDDPRAELIRRLQEYERFKKAAEDLDKLPREGRDFFSTAVEAPDYQRARVHPTVDLKEVLLALQDVLRRADLFESHQVEREKLTTRERMSEVLTMLSGGYFVPFVSLFRIEEGRAGVVVTFIAILELAKESLLELVQNEAFGPIHVRSRSDAGDRPLDLGDDAVGAESAFEDTAFHDAELELVFESGLSDTADIRTTDSNDDSAEAVVDVTGEFHV